MNKIAKDICKLVLAIGLCGIIGKIIFANFFPEQYFNAYPYIPLFFVLFGIATLPFLEKVKKDQKKFYLTFMLTKAGKMFICLLIALIYAFLNKESIFPFLITFVIFYVIYTVFEVKTSMNLNKDLQNESVQKTND